MGQQLPELSIGEIRARFADCCLGGDIRYLPTVDSTNRFAADLPPGTWSSGTIVVTDFQSAGRGRSGRAWLSPPGAGVMLSVIFRRASSTPAADYVMMMALAARDAIATAAHIDVQLKWPNDLLAGGRKIAGILGESSAQNGIDRVILGIGINVNFGDVGFPVLPETATSLDLVAGHRISREEVAVALIQSLGLWYRGLTHRPNDIFAAWAEALDTIGLAVSVTDAETNWDGIALGVQRDGGLLVETHDGSVRSVYAGDVSVRRSRGFTAQ